jgi:hypothetical protein
MGSFRSLLLQPKRLPHTAFACIFDNRATLDILVEA